MNLRSDRINFLFNLQAQFTIEKIHFESANPYSFNDIITDLENQETQKEETNN